MVYICCLYRIALAVAKAIYYAYNYIYTNNHHHPYIDSITVLSDVHSKYIIIII